MKSLCKVTKEDLGAAIDAFRNDSFDFVNIIANRIMANAVFGTDTKIFLPGFFLKEAARTFVVLKIRKEPSGYSTAKSHGFKYVESLARALSLSSLDEAELWKEFHDFSNRMRKFEMNEFEERSYSDNVEFTRNTFSWLLKHLNENKHLLFDSRSFLFKGTLNEMERIFRAHSGGLPETALISLIKALDRYYGYVGRAHMKSNRHIDEEAVKSKIFPYIDRIGKSYKQELDIKEVDEILWELVKGWRELFIQYMELPGTRVTFEKGIELPAELKKKLSEGITKALEKKI
jgi:hypothetical protein